MEDASRSTLATIQKATEGSSRDIMGRRQLE